MKNKQNKILKKLKRITKESLNFITNLAAPLISLAIILLAFIPGIPPTLIIKLKKAEYILFQASGTLSDIEQELINFKLKHKKKED